MDHSAKAAYAGNFIAAVALVAVCWQTQCSLDKAERSAKAATDTLEVAKREFDEATAERKIATQEREAAAVPRVTFRSFPRKLRVERGPDGKFQAPKGDIGAVMNVGKVPVTAVEVGWGLMDITYLRSFEKLDPLTHQPGETAPIHRFPSQLLDEINKKTPLITGYVYIRYSDIGAQRYITTYRITAFNHSSSMKEGNQASNLFISLSEPTFGPAPLDNDILGSFDE